MASKRSNVGAIIGGTVVAAGAVGILGWWWWVYREQNPAQPKGQKGQRSQLLAAVVEDEDSADLAASKQPGPAVPDPGPQVPTVSLSGA